MLPVLPVLALGMLRVLPVLLALRMLPVLRVLPVSVAARATAIRLLPMAISPVQGNPLPTPTTTGPPPPPAPLAVRAVRVDRAAWVGRVGREAVQVVQGAARWATVRGPVAGA